MWGFLLELECLSTLQNKYKSAQQKLTCGLQKREKTTEESVQIYILVTAQSLDTSLGLEAQKQLPACIEGLSQNYFSRREYLVVRMSVKNLRNSCRVTYKTQYWLISNLQNRP